jgi:hypothetical protein
MEIYESVTQTLQNIHQKLCVNEHNMNVALPLKQYPVNQFINSTSEENASKVTNADEVLVYNERFNSAKLTTSYNHMTNARMFLGDILLELGKFEPYDNKRKDKSELEHLILHPSDKIDWNDIAADDFKKRLNGKAAPGGFSTGAVHSFITPQEFEISCITYYKKFLGNAKSATGLFYYICGIAHSICAAHSLYLEQLNLDELTLNRRQVAMDVFINNLLTNLTLSNKYFGLRIGEIYS